MQGAYGNLDQLDHSPNDLQLVPVQHSIRRHCCTVARERRSPLAQYSSTRLNGKKISSRRGCRQDRHTYVRSASCSSTTSPTLPLPLSLYRGLDSLPSLLRTHNQCQHQIPNSIFATTVFRGSGVSGRGGGRSRYTRPRGPL